MFDANSSVRCNARSIFIAPAQPGDMQALLKRGVRRHDVQEAFKATALPVEQALDMAVESAGMAGSVFIHGRIACLFGVNASSLLYSHGLPWLVAHESFEDPTVAVGLARLSRRFINHWLDVFGVLENVADPEHTKGIAYLRWLGFSFDFATPVYGPLGHRLVRFRRKKTEVAQNMPQALDAGVSFLSAGAATHLLHANNL